MMISSTILIFLSATLEKENNCSQQTKILAILGGCSSLMTLGMQKFISSSQQSVKKIKNTLN
jgi:hypothetical protein